MDQASGLQQILAKAAAQPAAQRAASTPVPVSHQASSLLATGARTPCRAIAVAGGKGGVGKSTVAVNLAMALSIADHEVVLLDADMGLANVDVMLGLTPSRHIGHLLDGECTLEELLLPAARGLQVVPAGSGTRRLAQLNNGEHAAIIRAFDDLVRPPEYLVVDTAAGLADNVTMFAAAAAEVILVVCDEPASLTDAYGLTKVLSRDYGVRRVRMVANMVRNASEARALHQKLARVSDRFLDVVIDFAGWVPHDERLRQAIRRQCAVVDVWPSSHASQAFKKLADLVDKWIEPDRAALDRIAFFGGRNMPAAGVPK
ncbi:MAG: MinD/ParA family protein [Rhodanobacter sp.]|nr:MAG: MinD/ParA family protein [Rhodanobacter sp.]TAM06998.1 MAG: MinD/ParA family protein [Rhodanobacter sp.]TAM39521.1 MAG: MinD/ParA family protein [Rhodanobacter sp.]TAN28363.1 MAG: MinD/ParA family protein [Rhodanobacter sp.]